MRLFVALEMPDAVLDRLVRVQEALRETTGSSVRWVRPEGIHLTLKFLGEVQAEALGGICGALSGVRSPPLRLESHGIGFFPGPARPRIIWAGLEEPTGNLALLQEEVEARMETRGFAREDRPFHPHLTLGRARSPRGERRVVEAARALPDTGFGAFTAEAIHLYRSELHPKGAIYTRMETFALAAGEEP